MKFHLISFVLSFLKKTFWLLKLPSPLSLSLTFLKVGYGLYMVLEPSGPKMSGQYLSESKLAFLEGKDAAEEQFLTVFMHPTMCLL